MSKADETQASDNLPRYNVIQASQSYSNIAAVLAGFAFAAVVLVIQIPLPTPPTNINIQEWKTFRDWATISFLLAFVGCIVSAFTFAAVTGEGDKPVSRSYTIALLGGAGFSISTILVIWGLTILTRILLSEKVYEFIYWAFPFVMLLGPLYVAVSALDPITGIDRKVPTWRDWVKVFAPSVIILLASVVIKYSSPSLSATITSLVNFASIMFGALLIIGASGFGALYVSGTKSDTFRLPLVASGIWIGIHSLVVGILILMI